MADEGSHFGGNTGRILISVSSGAAHLELNSRNQLLTITREGENPHEMRSSDLAAIIYDDASEMMTVETSSTDGRESVTLSPIDREDWARLQLFLLDRPELGTGPVAQRSRGALQIVFPGDRESMLKIDVAGERLFVEPAGAKGFAPPISNVDTVSFDAGAATLRVELVTSDRQVAVDLMPMTRPMWNVLEAFLTEHEQLQLTLVEAEVK